MKKEIVIGLLLLVIGALGVGAYMMHNMMQRGFSTRVEPMQMEKALATTIREQAIPSRYKTMKNPVIATPEVIHEGMAHWADHCTACHANNGGGDTMYGKAMYPRPPDMRQKDTQELSDGELYYTIKNGVRLSGMPSSTITAEGLPARKPTNYSEQKRLQATKRNSNKRSARASAM